MKQYRHSGIMLLVGLLVLGGSVTVQAISLGFTPPVQNVISGQPVSVALVITDLGQLTPPCVALIPETVIKALHKVTSILGCTEMTERDQMSFALIRPFTGKGEQQPIGQRLKQGRPHRWASSFPPSLTSPGLVRTHVELADSESAIPMRVQQFRPRAARVIELDGDMNHVVRLNVLIRISHHHRAVRQPLPQTVAAEFDEVGVVLSVGHESPR